MICVNNEELIIKKKQNRNCIFLLINKLRKSLKR